jgi:nucleoside 2-deoxyribosyltransferase
MAPKLYVAGPLFSDSEKTFNRELKQILSPFFSVYLPQEDGELLVDLIAAGEEVGRAMTRIFESDLQAIRDTDVLLMVMDGRVPDEGACFELGVAYAMGKTCVGLQTDVRRLLAVGNNPMIAGAFSHTFSRIQEVVDWASAWSVSR